MVKSFMICFYDGEIESRCRRTCLSTQQEAACIRLWFSTIAVVQIVVRDLEREELCGTQLHGCLDPVEWA
jgi:hypothetical protein